MRKSLFCLILLGSLCGSAGLCFGQGTGSKAPLPSIPVNHHTSKDTKVQPKHLTINGVTFDVPEEFDQLDIPGLEPDTSVMLQRSYKTAQVFLIVPSESLSQDKLLDKVKHLAANQLTPTKSQEYDWKALPSSKESKYETDMASLLGFNQKSLIIVEYHQLLYKDKRILIGYYIQDKSPASELAARFRKGLGTFSMPGADAITSIISSITGEKFEPTEFVAPKIRPKGGAIGIPLGPPMDAPTSSIAKVGLSADGNLHYQIGGRIIAIPPPKGFVEAYEELPQLRKILDSTEGLTNSILAVYIPAEQYEQVKRGAEVDTSVSTKVSILKKAIGDEMTVARFEKITRDSEKIEPLELDLNGPLMKSAVKQLETSMTDSTGRDTKIDFTQPVNLGRFRKTSNVHSTMYAIRTKVRIANRQGEPTILCASSFVLINHRLIYAFAFRPFKSEKDVKELRDFSTTWVDQILAANTN